MNEPLAKQDKSQLWQLYNKAAQLMNNNQLEDAKSVCQQIFSLDKENPNAHKIYGMILKHQGHFQDAIKSFNLILNNPAEKASYLDITMYLFECLEALDKHQDVVQRVDNLLKEYPFDIRLLYLKAKILAKKGEVQKALEHYKQVVMFPSPNDLVHQEIKAYSHLYILTAPSLKPIPNDIELATNLLAQTHDEYVQSTLYFAIGHGFERVEAYSQALQAFTQGNELMWQTNRLDFNQMLENFDQIKLVNWLNRDLNCQQETNQEMPIFIEGIPRSGSTLVESLISEYPGVEACGEVSYLSNAISEVARTKKQTEESLVLEPNQNSLKAIKDHYLQALQKQHKSSLMFTDKMLNNYEYIGVKALAFPNSKFIHIYKNPVDAAFSMYRQTFKLGEHTYSYNLRACAFMVKYSKHCIDHWKTIFPDRIYEINYEEAIKLGEDAWKDLFEWLGFDWQSKYLDFYHSKRDVETMSSAQVRQQLTNRYSNRSEKYGDLLDDLRNFLEMPIEQLANVNQ